MSSVELVANNPAVPRSGRQIVGLSGQTPAAAVLRSSSETCGQLENVEQWLLLGPESTNPHQLGPMGLPRESAFSPKRRGSSTVLCPPVLMKSTTKAFSQRYASCSRNAGKGGHQWKGPRWWTAHDVQQHRRRPEEDFTWPHEHCANICMNSKLKRTCRVWLWLQS